MNVRELTVFAAVSAMSLFSAVAADKPGVIVLKNGQRIECADINQKVLKQELGYKLSNDAKELTVSKDDVDYFQFNDGENGALGNKWKSFQHVTSSKFTKNQIKPTKMYLPWAECVVDGPTSVYRISTAGTTSDGRTFVEHKFYVTKDDWNYGVDVPGINKFNKKDDVAFFKSLFADNQEMVAQLDAKGYDYIDAHFSNRHKRFDYVARDLNLLTDLIEEYNGSVDK